MTDRVEAETPNTVHGRLLEAVHIAGYTFERACGELEFLLDEDRWKSVGGGFTDINAFLATIDFSNLRIAIDQRKKLAKRLQAIDASQRATARLIGVSQPTILRDLSDTNESRSEAIAKETEPSTLATDTNESAAWFQRTTVDPSVVAKRAIKQERRQQVAEAVIARVNLPDAKCRVILADPPWSYNDKSDAGPVQRGGGAEQHYPSMSIPALCEYRVNGIAVRDLAEEDAVLFLWVTSPLLPEAFPVIEAWGFTYRASWIWDKVRHNMGHYSSVRHEFLLICTRGRATPDHLVPFDSVVSVERTTHSRKPEIFRQMIDTLYPNGQRLELFAREVVPGWEAVGNQLNDPAVAAS